MSVSESALNGLGIVVAMWTLTLPARDGTPSELISPNFEAGFYEELRGEVQGSKSRVGWDNPIIIILGAYPDMS